MGVQTRVIVYADDDRAERVARAAFRRIAEIEDALSDYRVGNQIDRLRSAPVGVPQPVSGDLAAALHAAGRVYHASGGLYDPTVGPLTRIWRRARDSRSTPNPGELSAASESVGWRHVTFEHAPPSLTFHRPGMSLDFGGLGKGMAAHAAVEAIRAEGVERCLVALAGDVFCGAPPPGSQGWQILISDGVPTSRPGDHPGTLLLRDTGVSTSGDSVQVANFDGVAVSHLVRPHESSFAAPRRRAVTVVGANGALIDAAATAITVAPDPLMAARELASKLTGIAVVVSPEGDDPSRTTIIDPSGILREFRSGTFHSPTPSTRRP